MEFDESHDDILLIIFFKLFPTGVGPKSNMVRQILRLGAVSKQLQRVEQEFWKQNVHQNLFFASKLKNSPKFKNNSKALHLTHYFGCSECSDLTRFSCEQCATKICFKCYDGIKPSCNCNEDQWEPKFITCINCQMKCRACCTVACQQCYQTYEDCYLCSGGTCLHQLQLIKCACKKEKFVHIDEDRCGAEYQESFCHKCSKDTCTDCSVRCRNCNNIICHPCSMRVSKFNMCADRCSGSGLCFSTCTRCSRELIYASFLDCGRCDICLPQKSGSAKPLEICQACVKTCQRCQRRLCTQCTPLHECNSTIKCQKCKKDMTKINRCKNCQREVFCDTCQALCNVCGKNVCDVCHDLRLNEDIRKKFRFDDDDERLCRGCWQEVQLHLVLNS